MRILSLVAVPFFSLFIGVVAAADSQPMQTPKSPTDVMRSAQQGAAEIEQLRTALRGPDASVRVATFVAMIESNNVSLTALAINEGHAGSDAVLRDLTARAAFRELQGFTVEPVKELSPEVEKLYRTTFSDADGLQSTITNYDWTTGKFGLKRGYGQISGSRMEFRSNHCQGNLAAVEGSWAFEGNVVCNRGGASFSERMRLVIR